MSVKNWLRGRSGGSENPDAKAPSMPRTADLPGSKPMAQTPTAETLLPVLTEVDRSAMVVGGLNFMDAIAAHQKWKTRLTAYLGGNASEKLEYRTICRDDRCVLGQWINGVGGVAYGDAPLFCQLKITHAQFHLAAGNIVRLQDEGKTELAQEALRQGEYPQYSIKVQGLISSLYLEVKGYN